MAQERQISDPKTVNYNNKVLIGNWFEEAQNYKKTYRKPTTEYSTQYLPKPITANLTSQAWSLRLSAEKTFYPEKTSDDSPNFFENYASLNDLSYNYIPKLLALSNRSPKSIECINSFGNVTNYGIGDHKRRLWACEEYSKPYSIYNLYYRPPDREDYLFHRWLMPRAVPGKYGPTYRPLPENHPRFDKCNPLTWECKKRTVVNPMIYKGYLTN